MTHDGDDPDFLSFPVALIVFFAVKPQFDLHLLSMEVSNGSGNRVAGACYLMPFASLATHWHVYKNMFVVYSFRSIYMHAYRGMQEETHVIFQSYMLPTVYKDMLPKTFSIAFDPALKHFHIRPQNQVVHYVVDGHGSGDPHIGVMQRASDSVPLDACFFVKACLPAMEGKDTVIVTITIFFPKFLGWKFVPKPNT